MSRIVNLTPHTVLAAAVWDRLLDAGHAEGPMDPSKLARFANHPPRGWDQAPLVQAALELMGPERIWVQVRSIDQERALLLAQARPDWAGAAPLLAHRQAVRDWRARQDREVRAAMAAAGLPSEGSLYLGPLQTAARLWETAYPMPTLPDGWECRLPPIAVSLHPAAPDGWRLHVQYSRVRADLQGDLYVRREPGADALWIQVVPADESARAAMDRECERYWNEDAERRAREAAERAPLRARREEEQAEIEAAMRAWLACGGA